MSRVYFLKPIVIIVTPAFDWSWRFGHTLCSRKGQRLFITALDITIDTVIAAFQAGAIFAYDIAVNRGAAYRQ